MLSLEQVQAALEAAPFHRWLGLKAIRTDPEKLVLEMPWREEVVSNPPMAVSSLR